MDIEVLRFKSTKCPGKILHVIKQDGWLAIAKLPPGRDNIFFSIEEIEIVVDDKLEEIKNNS